ncbi:MAG TPA: calcium/sodium antiporter [Phycisphaerae bacterium]|nr:calcium/sodium antiporter [Phycisphaerae bacterium]
MLAALIPESFYVGLEQDSAWALWLLAAGAIVLLVLGADRVVTAAVRLAAVLGMSKVIIGATVVSLGTTSPEAFTSVTAAFQGKPGLALGNGIGSIICDTALIFGLCAWIQRLPLDRSVLNRHGWLQLGAGALLTGVILLGALFAGGIAHVEIPRWVGFLFLALLAGYMALSVRWARGDPRLLPADAKVEQVKAPAAPPASPLGASLWNLLILAAGLALVIFGSTVLVGSASALCHKYGVPQSVLAATLVAFGTSLPELVTAIVSLVKGHADLLVGNIVGADILNVLFVVGASAAATPLRVEKEVFLILLPVMMLVLILLRLFIFVSRDRFHRWQGAVLVGVYVAYCAAVIGFGVGRAH